MPSAAPTACTRHPWLPCLMVLASVGCAPAPSGGGDGPSGEDAARFDGAPEPSPDGAPGPDAGSMPDAAPEVDPGPPAAGDRPLFAFPVHPEDRRWIHPGLFFGFDHDPVDADAIVCTAYDGRGFPFCYDAHEGSDFVLDGGFDRMDAGSARVVAAAGGEVIEAVDGHYDRCSGNLEMFEPMCDGRPVRANRVVLRHANGWRTRYLHLMQGSVTVAVGDRVDCGDVLGRVGSSGRSYTPHLHFEVQDAAGVAVDPFAGEVSGPEGMWVEQRADDLLPGPMCDPAWGPAR